MRPGSYRRALILAAIDEIRSTDEQIIKVLTEYLPDHITTVMDAVGSWLVNISGKSVKQNVKHILNVPNRRDKSEDGGSFVGKFVKLPNGIVVDLSG